MALTGTLHASLSGARARRVLPTIGASKRAGTRLPAVLLLVAVQSLVLVAVVLLLTLLQPGAPALTRTPMPTPTPQSAPVAPGA